MPTILSKARFLGGLGMTVWGDIPPFTVIPSGARNLAFFMVLVLEG
jgi:hypothetical protein